MPWVSQQAVREEQGSPTEKLTLLEGGGRGGGGGRGKLGGKKRWGIEGKEPLAASAGAEANYRPSRSVCLFVRVCLCLYVPMIVTYSIAVCSFVIPFVIPSSLPLSRSLSLSRFVWPTCLLAGWLALYLSLYHTFVCQFVSCHVLSLSGCVSFCVRVWAFAWLAVSVYISLSLCSLSHSLSLSLFSSLNWSSYEGTHLQAPHPAVGTCTTVRSCLHADSDASAKLPSTPKWPHAK